MPCNSDHMEPNEREKAHQRAAHILVSVKRKVGHYVDPALEAAAKDPYCRHDFVGDVCGMLRGLDEETFERVVYTARDRESRRIADWWEEHLEYDNQRNLAIFKKAIRDNTLNGTLLFTLSNDVRKALGTDDNNRVFLYLHQQLLSVALERIIHVDLHDEKENAILEQLPPTFIASVINGDDRSVVDKANLIAQKYRHQVMLVSRNTTVMPEVQQAAAIFIEVCMDGEDIVATVKKLRTYPTLTFSESLRLKPPATK